ncbi:ATP-grasp domain-containing protein [Bacillus suaedaesalsae]|uniref:ATP-grasp domain-containing protein n=1 Tax=Bacillus suaedaesalsae TaxID=2810349 RepID=A0ABS2DIB2_9BACI|nr:ATP-grasp domain-containing protein [Bacillus suaedaesalsae]MBM6618232.1 ATP-grasp domain-containing protein [Bacillus suaedaesalsae]
MQTILFIGSNKSGTSRDALKTAEELGYFVVLFTDREKFIQQREEFCEVHQMIYFENLLDKELLLNEIEKLQLQGKEIKGCISFIDPFVNLAATLSNEMELSNLSTDALYLMEDKTRFREMMIDHPATPMFDVFRPHIDTLHNCIERHHSSLPLIIKSPVSNGSKDVILVDTKEKLKQGLNKFLSLNPYSVLIEEYLEGPQYLVEVLVHDGEVHIVGVVEQKITKMNRFIVTDYLFPAILKEIEYQKLVETVESITSTLGVINGSCHLEIRLVDGDWKLIEINPRMSGGAMNRIIHEGIGVNLVKETISLYLGEVPNLQGQHHRYVYGKYLTVNSRGKLLKVTGKKRASMHEGVIDVYVKPRKGSILSPPLSMGDRYAYVLAAAETPQKAKEIAINAAKEIKFFLEPL